MRFARKSVVFVLSLTLVTAVWIEAAAQSEGGVSGTVLSENGAFLPAMTLVTLTQTGVTVAAAYTDAAGRFTFRGVPPGSYTIHISVDGYEKTSQAVEVSQYDGFAPESIVMLTRKHEVIRPNTPHTIDISQFLERYPKKAVESFRKGMEYKDGGQNDSAVKQFEEAVKIAPAFYQAYNELGIAYKHAGRYDDAETAFLRAHYLNGSNADPLVNLTGLYIEKDRPDDAVITGEKAIKVNSRSAPAFFNLGMALFKLAKLDRSETILRKALELAPKMAPVRLLLANVYLKLRRYDNVMEQLDNYLAENPKGEHRAAVEQMRRNLLKAREEQRQP